MTDPDQATIRPIYTAMDYVVRLDWTTLHNGGGGGGFYAHLNKT